MLITNKSDSDIECIVDCKALCIRKNETVMISDAVNLELKHSETSYVCDETGKSIILKVLSFFDDPFKTKKEYHICVDSTFDISNCPEDHKMTIQQQSLFADAELFVFYEYYVLRDDNHLLIPDSVKVSDDNDICRLFAEYNKIHVKWSAIYNIFIEPIVSEIIGYILIYWLFSLWIGRKALWVIGILLAINVLIEIMMFVMKDKHSDTNRLCSLLTASDIIHRCYVKAD